MQAEQAVFASADCQHRKGYQLVAHSEGIDPAMAQSLCRWAPSHGTLVDPKPAAWSLNYFRVDSDHVAVARTTHGGAEYSGRGGMQVVTTFLVIPLDAFTLYDNDPLAVARTAMALGYLRLPHPHNEHRAPIRLPDRSLPLPSFKQVSEDRPSSHSDSALELLLNRRRVMIVGETRPLTVVHRLIEQLPPGMRLDLSFTTGLTWSMQREFQVQFLPSVDPALRQKLLAQNIICTAA